VTLDEAVGTIRMAFAIASSCAGKTCPKCGGKGFDKTAGCSECNGQGRIGMNPRGFAAAMSVPLSASRRELDERRYELEEKRYELECEKMKRGDYVPLPVTVNVQVNQIAAELRSIPTEELRRLASALAGPSDAETDAGGDPPHSGGTKPR